MNKVYEENRIQAIADAIREKTGTDTTYTTAEMPNGIDEVYAAGKQEEWNAFWDMFQDKGNRTTYEYAFKNWTEENIRPKYKVVPTDVNGVLGTFNGCKKLKKIEKEHFDFSQKPTGANNNTGYYYTFDGCNNLEEIEDIGLVPQFCYVRTFGYCYKLKTIAKMGVNENTSFSNAFVSCRDLENLTIEGRIGKNGLNLKDSTKLSRSSIESVINALSDTVEGMPTVTLSKTAVENAFSVSPNLILPRWNITQTEHDGLTITDNGDGSFTLNGTYQNEQYHELFFTVDENVTWSEREGMYGLFLEGDTTNSIDIYTHGATDALLGQGWNYVLELGNEPLSVNLVIPSGVTFQNVTVRPKLLYDEWQSLIWHKSHFWDITLV